MNITSRDTRMALREGASSSSIITTLIWWVLVGFSQDNVSPTCPLDGQNGRHSCVSMDDNVTTKNTSCSQTICQKANIVFSIGCWVMINSLRSKKPIETKQNFIIKATCKTFFREGSENKIICIWNITKVEKNITNVTPWYQTLVKISFVSVQLHYPPFKLFVTKYWYKLRYTWLEYVIQIYFSSPLKSFLASAKIAVLAASH